MHRNTTRRRATGAFLIAGVALASVSALAQDPPLPLPPPPIPDGLPVGYGVEMASGAKATTSISFGEDVDDYVFDGTPGMKLKASLKVSKKSDVHATMVLFRPDGTIVTIEDDGVKLTSKEDVLVTYRDVDPNDPEAGLKDLQADVPLVTKVKVPIDQTGPWKLRVYAPDAFVNLPDDMGEYTISTKTGNPKPVSEKNTTPDENDQLVFLLPAKGGATVDFSLAFRGADVTFNGLFSPTGDLVDIPVGDVDTKQGKLVRAKKIAIPEGSRFGDYRVVFDVPAGGTLSKGKFKGKAKFPKIEKLRGKLDRNEPVVIASEAQPAITPAVGGPGTQVVIRLANAYDSNKPQEDPVVLLNGFELKGPLGAGGPAPKPEVTEIPGGFLVRGSVPSGIPAGAFNVIARTGTGQVDVAADAFERVPPPKADDIDPRVGSAAGGYPVTITGSNFIPGQIGILIDGADVPVQITAQTTTSVTFTAPPRAPEFVTFGVRDSITQLTDNLTLNSFEYLATPGISRVFPELLSVLGGDTIFVKGSNFSATDRVFMETTTPDVFEEIFGTFQDQFLHSFAAPVRPKGVYEVYVRDAQGVRTSGTHEVTYFTFADFTADLGLSGPPENDLRDAWTTALSDFDQDGDPDLFLGLRGTGGVKTEGHIKVFENDGTGAFTDITGDVIPPSTSTDDWRSDRIRVADANQDGYPDIYIATDSETVPAAAASHVRILVSERRSASAPAGDRVFRDKTSTLMAPPRGPGSGYGGSSGTGDNWRALDMWVGDVDRGPAGPPEVLITGKQLFEEIDVLCGNYCSSSVGGALYRFYWPAARAFRWDTTKRGGLGQYRFDPNFFPRKSGVLVPIGNPPPGATIPACNQSTPCRGTFTPFSGHTLLVDDLNADGKPDIVVLNDQQVTKEGQAISSTQIAINKFDTSAGSAITDVTEQFMFATTRYGTGTIGHFGYPDGNAFGSIVLSNPDAADGDPATRIFRFLEPADPDDVASFQDITAQVMPSTTAVDHYQASAVIATDVDGDLDDDLILVAHEAPDTGVAAFRMLRNNIVANQAGIFGNDYDVLLAGVFSSSGDVFDGTSILVGDLNGDDRKEYIVTRSVPEGEDSQTRALTTDF